MKPQRLPVAGNKDEHKEETPGPKPISPQAAQAIYLRMCTYRVTGAKYRDQECWECLTCNLLGYALGDYFADQSDSNILAPATVGSA